MEDRCVCCGEVIPEGRQVCYQCELKVEEAKTAFISIADAITEVFNKIAEAFRTFWENIKKLFRDYLNELLRIPKDERDPSTKRYIFYISKILGKSNNWRKMHHIPMTRR